MPVTFDYNTYRITIDPLDHYPTVNGLRLVEACGVLLQWAADYFTAPPAASLKDHMEAAYGFGNLIPIGPPARIEGNRMVYVGDPDLYPLATLEQPSPSVRCLIYPHAIIALVENGETFITRMD